MTRLCSSLGAALCTVLVACTAPRPTPVPPLPAARPPQMTATRLLPGCLLPAPSSFAAVVGPEGRVGLRVLVGASGDAIEAQVTSPSGADTLDSAFVDAALRCRFVPATRDGVATQAAYVMTHAWVTRHGFNGPLRCFTPEYPRRALSSDSSGEIRIRFRLAGGDLPPEVVPASTTGDRLLTKSAFDAVSACLAHPEAREGLRLNAWYELPIVFKIE